MILNPKKKSLNFKNLTIHELRFLGLNDLSSNIHFWVAKANPKWIMYWYFLHLMPRKPFNLQMIETLPITYRNAFKVVVFLFHT